MKADYKNWVPRGMVFGFAAGAAIAIALWLTVLLSGVVRGGARTALGWILGIAAIALTAVAVFMMLWHRAFSYNGKRQLSRQIVEGTAAYITLPDGGRGLDVGCGSGALTIACAKRNPRASMVGIDRWGREYASYNKALCEQNARAEGVRNTSFAQGDAVKLAFPDESFDAVTSNYVYHNIVGVDKQQLLLESLRVLKKGGCFAIHDLMSKARYGDMEAFAARLRSMGFERVEVIDTTRGMFMRPLEARFLMLGGSTLLVEKK